MIIVNRRASDICAKRTKLNLPQHVFNEEERKVMNLRIRDRWSLFIYNWIRGPFNQWNFRRRFLSEWLAEGRDPALFPKFGRMDLSTLDWARGCIKEIDPNALSREYWQWRDELKSKKT